MKEKKKLDYAKEIQKYNPRNELCCQNKLKSARVVMHQDTSKLMANPMWLSLK